MKDSYGNTAPSAWSLLCAELGEACAAKECEGKQLWTEGAFNTYTDWMIRSAGLLKEYGLTRSQFEAVLNGVDYNHNVVQTLRSLQGRFRTVMITGGFVYQAKKAQQDCALNAIYASCNLLWNTDGSLQGWDLAEYDYDGKTATMQQEASRHGVSLQECYFIGDGKNDRAVAQVVGTSIAFNGPAELQVVTTYAVNQPDDQEDFAAVLEYLQ